MNTNRPKIVMVDDNSASLAIGKSLLGKQYEVYGVSSAEKMFHLLEKVLPDLILLDINMPQTDGYETLQQIKSIRRFSNIPVIFLTSQRNEASEVKGFSLGGADYVTKPFSPPILMKRIKNQLLIASQKETIHQHSASLSLLLGKKSREILSLQNALIQTVANLVEFRDDYAKGHNTRTQLYMGFLLEELLQTGKYQQELALWNMDFILPSVQLHDVGKIAIPESILNKHGELTSDEFDILKTHVEIGLAVVDQIMSDTLDKGFLRHVRHIIATHHEKWDGSGYPAGLAEFSIPLEGRLMAIADKYDSLVFWRPYQGACSPEKAKEIIVQGSGTHFEPSLVDAFLTVYHKIYAVVLKHRMHAAKTDS